MPYSLWCGICSSCERLGHSCYFLPSPSPCVEEQPLLLELPGLSLELGAAISSLQALRSAGWTVSLLDVADTDHFDIIEKLSQRDYVLTQVRGKAGSLQALGAPELLWAWLGGGDHQPRSG